MFSDVTWWRRRAARARLVAEQAARQEQVAEHRAAVRRILTQSGRPA